jgi:hypothetical protein
MLLSSVTVYGVIDWNECNTEKCYECVNMGKVK